MRKGICKQGHLITGENVYAPSPSASPRCLECRKAQQESYVPKRTQRLATERRWRKKNPRYFQGYRYGVSPEEYQTKLKDQNSCCKICNRIMESPHIDHDHETNQVRDLLCRTCNLGIGHLQDDVLIVERALEYLKKWKS